MTGTTQTLPTHTFFRMAGSLAIASGVISAIGVVFLIAMFAMFSASNQPLVQTFGLINDICVAVQYALSIPVALVLYRILSPHKPLLVTVATAFGIVMMIAVIILQILLIFGVMPFEQQVGWVTMALIPGIGSWLVITGFVARLTGRLPGSLLMSMIAVTYLGFPVWAFWIGRRLSTWQDTRI